MKSCSIGRKNRVHQRKKKDPYHQIKVTLATNIIVIKPCKVVLINVTM